MRQHRFQGYSPIWLGLLGWIAIAPVAIAQIVPDGTLGTQTVGNCAGNGGNCGILGGTQRGGNLFHSLQRFSLPNGDTALFIVEPTVQNAIVRVTGQGRESISTINGTISTLNVINSSLQPSQPVNFFLLNPNGIVFGANARLNIGGSFLATTAERMQFQDGTLLNVRDPTPLLTVRVPVGLQMGSQFGTIQSQMQIGAGINSRFTDFALVGSNVSLDDSTILAPGRRIELAGLGENSALGLELNGNALKLNISENAPRANVSLAAGSVLFVRSDGGGEIAITANQLEVKGSSLLAGIDTGLDSAGNRAGDMTLDVNELLLSDRAQISNNTYGQGSAGDLTITVRDRAFLSDSIIASQVEPGAIGNAGKLTLSAGELVVTDGAQISASTFGRGDAGDLTIAVRDRATFDGQDQTGNPSGAFSLVGAGEIGNGGTFSLSAGSLFVSNGADLSTTTKGQGNAGNMELIIRDAAVFDGEGQNGNNSGASTAVSTGAKGNGGNLLLSTGTLRVSNGAQLNADTFAQGNAGDLTIIVRDIAIFDGDGREGDPSSAGSSVQAGAVGNGGNFTLSTGSLWVTNGAQLVTATVGRGNAGALEITARDRITVQGVGRDGGPSGIGSSVESGAVGDAAALKLFTRELQISDRAFIQSSSSGDGTAADLTIKAQQIKLEDRGLIRANSLSGNGANIRLNVGELLLLRRGSEISATAGLTGGSGNGGSITIDAPNGFIVAVLKENSDIFANAFTGSGGRVNITAQGIYGLRFQPRLTPFSDITASSAFGVSGVVAINTLGLDPSGGFVQLPAGLVDPSNKIDQRCAPKGSALASTFTITGTGGIAASPTDPLMPQATLMELVPLPEDGSGLQTDKRIAPSAPTSDAPIVEAQGWIVDRDGTVHLVADARAGIPQHPSLVPPDCSIQPSLPVSQSSR
jgi:filamentous hemagglutinin family protein